jgi:flagellar assembly protein FliH
MIDNGEEKPAPTKTKEDIALTLSQERERLLREEQELLETQRNKLLEEQAQEFKTMKDQYEEQCKQVLAEAEQRAMKTVEDAADTAELLRNSAMRDCENLKKAATDDGYKAGFAAGEKPGYDAGFAAGKAECAETLAEITAVIGRIPAEKERIFKEYENRLFDLIFTVSNKITAGSLNQKDKSVISRMLKEAAKSFRGSSDIKVSLSKLDVEESVNVDLNELRAVFGENQNIEFEILKDAPKGTLILDNGSEITDAGIQTQLKMIENLGKGKFR